MHGLQKACLLHGQSSWYRRTSIGSIATHSTADVALRFAAAPDDVDEFRWSSWLPRNGRHQVLVFLHFPSTINQSVVHLEVQTCPPPSIAAFANGLSMPGSCRLGKRFQWRRVPLFRYVMPGSNQRGALFLTVEGHNESVPVVSRSLLVALSSTRTESS